MIKVREALGNRLFLKFYFYLKCQKRQNEGERNFDPDHTEH